jgi:2,4-dienoyl-CoA reductase-like NADH-dependent reductase (Old Yellow Enzyme family)
VDRRERAPRFLGGTKNMSMLFSPFNLRSVTFRNRVFVSPMCQYSLCRRDNAFHFRQCDYYNLAV